MRQQPAPALARSVHTIYSPTPASCGRTSSAFVLHSIPEQKAAEEEVSIPVSSDPAASNGVYMAHGGQLKQRCVVTALIVASTFVLLALNTSIMVLTAKAYNITKQLGTAQAPVYSTDIGWALIWADEFDGNNLDGSSWTAQTGDGSAEGIPGWGNMELETYDAGSIAVGNGVLSISAQRTGVSFTSGRITSAAKRGFAPSQGETLRIEGRIQLPQGGDGIWPAFWMLPTASSNGSLPYGVWPRSGEIDVMESVNAFSQVYGTIHYGLPQQQLGAALSQSASTGVFAGAMHVYAVDWSRDQISWYMDGRRYATASSHCKAVGGWRTSSAPQSCSAPFDQPFGLLLNVAVGGLLPGKASGADTVFPQTMLVDYVRVYSDARWRTAATFNATRSNV